jgi:putative ABC transport system permease protein
VLKVELKGLVARKLRLTLTAFAIALGVMLMAGTYIFTDTINSSFDSIFQQSSRGTDVSLTPRAAFGNSNDNNAATLSLDGALLTKVKALPDVRSASGSIFGSGTILDKKGKRVNAGGGAPNFIASLQPAPFEGFTVAQGRMPQTADEVAIDQSTADKKSFHLGDSLGVQGQAARKDYKIVGITHFAGVSSFGGASVALVTLPEAQRVTGKVGRFDQIELSGKPGVSPAQLKAEVRQAVLQRDVNVRTGQEEARNQSDEIKKNLGFLRTALLVFAFISLFVGGFIIFNTFSITVAQRMREFALLRTLGATRRQVLRAVLTESLLLGLAGAVVGLLAGLGVASGLKALLNAFGVDLPANGTVVEPRTIVVSLLVGTIVTLLAGLAPALRATRVPPVAAMREGVALPRTRGSRLVTPIAGLLAALGVVLMAIGLFGGMKSGPALSLLGAGAVAVFLGVALLSPRLVRPLAWAVGAPLERMFGITGRLARENTSRQPGRTAVTAAALMIGLALVTFVSVFAAGFKATITQAVDTGVKGDLIVQNTDGFSAYSDATTPALKGVPGVAQVSPVRFAQAKVAGQSGTSSVTGVDPATFSAMYQANWEQGSDATLRALAPGQAVVSKKYADKHGVKVGAHLVVRSQTGAALPVTVTGIIHDKGGLVGDMGMPNSVLAKTFGKRDDALSFVKYAPGADPKATRAAVDGTLKRAFPAVEAKTSKEFKAQQAGQINQLLGLFYALLSLAIVVSLFGIVNTLVLSIHERTRELGMLRAIGTSRRQVKRMVRYEAVITSLIGAVLGAVIGLGLSLLVSQPLDDFVLSIPVGSILILLVLAGLAGVLAAIMPARRAAKLDVLESLAYE